MSPTTAINADPAPRRTSDAASLASMWRALLLVFCLTAIFAFAYPACRGLLHDLPAGDDGWYGAEEHWLGQHLALGHGFRMPIDHGDTALPSCWSPPLYPLWIALVYKIWGIGQHHAFVALWVAQAVIFGFASAALYALGRLMDSALTGWLAVLGHCAIPSFLRSNLDIWDHYCGLAVFLWLLVVAMLLRKRRATLVAAALLGGGLGILSQINAGYVLSYPLLVLVSAGGRLAGAPWKFKAALPWIGAALVGFIIVLAPWTIRNYFTFGRIIYVRGGMPLELLVGNYPGADGWLDKQMYLHHPNHNARERDEMLSVGEMPYFDHCMTRFLGNVHRMPGAFMSRCLRRAAYCLTGNPNRTPLPHEHHVSNRELKWPDPLPPWKAFWVAAQWNPVNTLVNLLGIAGTVVAIRRRNCGAWLPFAAALALAPFALASVENDPILQIRATLMLMAVYLLALALASIKRKWI